MRTADIDAACQIATESQCYFTTWPIITHDIPHSRLSQATRLPFASAIAQLLSHFHAAAQSFLRACSRTQHWALALHRRSGYTLTFAAFRRHDWCHRRATRFTTLISASGWCFDLHFLAVMSCRSLISICKYFKLLMILSLRACFYYEMPFQLRTLAFTYIYAYRWAHMGFRNKYDDHSRFDGHTDLTFIITTPLPDDNILSTAD